MIELSAVTEHEFSIIVSHAIQGFADECIEGGRWTTAEATLKV